MKLQLLDMPTKIHANTVQWLDGLAKNQELFTSKLPEKLSIFPDYNDIQIESLIFNKPITSEKHAFIFTKAPIKPCQNITLIDFGKHLWTKQDVCVLLDWLTDDCKSITYIQLCEAQFTIDAWKVLFSWLATQGVRLESLELGATRMSLPRVKSLHDACKSGKLKLEKLDFGESVWTVTHLKAFLWNLFSQPISLSRISLSAAHMSDEGLDLLMFYISSSYCPIKVFSSGIMKMSQKALGYTLDACILSEQSFMLGNANKLANLVTKKTKLKHLALLNCEWDESYGTPDKIDDEKSLQRIFVESVEYKQDNSGLIHALMSWGYDITRQTGQDGYCLRPHRQVDNEDQVESD